MFRLIFIVICIAIAAHHFLGGNATPDAKNAGASDKESKPGMMSAAMPMAKMLLGIQGDDDSSSYDKAGENQRHAAPSGQFHQRQPVRY